MTDELPVRHCPQCAEEVRAEARLCRFCRFELQEPTDGAVINQWIRAHPALTASLAAFLYVSFQIFKAGDFEVNASVELLRAGGVTSILIGVLLVQLPIELLLLSFAGCWWLVSSVSDSAAATDGATAADRQRRRQPLSMMQGDSRVPPLVLLAALLVLSFYTSPWPFFMLSLAFATLTGILAYRRQGGRHRLATYTRRTIAVLSVVGLLIMVQRPTIWVPLENIRTDGRDAVVAYVIASDGEWTTLLVPQWTGQETATDNVIRERSDQITAREPCALDLLEARLFSRILRLRSAQVLPVLRERAMPRPLTPPCP